MGIHMNSIKNKSHFYGIFFMLLIICIFQYGIQKIYGIVMYPDEFGYWASAAKWLGYDWSQLASMGPYYSYGYSLILTPILWMFENGVMAYRAAVAVNMVLMCISLCLIFDVLKKLFPKQDQQTVIFAGGVGVFYPAWIFYMQMTLTEALLMFLYILTVYLLIRFIEKPKVITSIGLACSLVYIYFVHMRTVGVVIACVLTVLLLVYLKPECRKAGVIFIVFLIALGLIGTGIKEAVVSQVYAGADAGMLAVNDYGGQWGKLQEIFTFRGFVRLLASCISKLFYLGMASFGLVYWAIGYLVIRVKHLIFGIVKKKHFEIVDAAALYILLSATGIFLITAIYMINPGRIDGIFYGRYNELFVPLMMSIGLMAMISNKKIFTRSITGCAISGLAVPLIAGWIKKEELVSFHNYFAVGITYLYDESNFNANHFFLQTYLFCSLLIILVAGLVWICKKGNKNPVILAGIILVEIGLGIWASEKDTYHFNAVVSDDKVITDYILDTVQTDSDIYYLYEESEMYIDSMQLLMKRKTIQLLENDEWKNTPLLDKDYLITDLNTAYREELEDTYELYKETASFLLFVKSDDDQTEGK